MNKLIRLSTLLTTMFFIFAPLLAFAEWGKGGLGTFSTRVNSIAGAALALQDESTELNELNFSNPAGLVLKPREDRLDLTLGYMADIESDADNNESARRTINFSNPTSEYSGLTYWLLNNLVMSIDAEGMSFSDQKKEVGQSEDNFDALGWSGTLRSAVQFNQIAIGGSIKLIEIQGAGKPPFHGRHDEYYIRSHHMAWQVGAAIHQLHVTELLSLTAGLAVGVGDEKPDIAAFGEIFKPLEIYGNYTTAYYDRYKVALGFGDPLLVNEQCKTEFNPLTSNVNIIFDYQRTLQFGVLARYDIEDVTRTNVVTYSDPGFAPINSSYHYARGSNISVIPILLGQAQINSGLKINYGALYSTEGSNNQDRYSLNSTTVDPNDTYKRENIKTNAQNFAVGIGCETLENKLIIATQFDQQRQNVHDTTYPLNGASYLEVSETRQQAIRVGAEYQVTREFAIRCGYSFQSNITPRVTINGHGQVDINRCSLGTGIKIANKTQVDLFTIYDIYSTTPQPTIKANHSAITGMAGLKQTF